MTDGTKCKIQSWRQEKKARAALLTSVDEKVENQFNALIYLLI